MIVISINHKHYSSTWNTDTAWIVSLKSQSLKVESLLAVTTSL